jgi:hypothetical protein
MRNLLLLFLAIFATISCVKTPSTEPVPTLEYKGVSPLGKVSTGGIGPRDTAVLILRYSDGDGDLFRNSNSDGPNLIYTTYAFNSDSNKFIMNGFPNPATITQPANGYYKGKSIHGDIYVPMRQFRTSDAIKVIKFEAFMVDMKNHKTNVVTSPVFTLNF